MRGFELSEGSRQWSRSKQVMFLSEEKKNVSFPRKTEKCAVLFILIRMKTESFCNA